MEQKIQIQKRKSIRSKAGSSEKKNNIIGETLSRQAKKRDNARTNIKHTKGLSLETLPTLKEQ